MELTYLEEGTLFHVWCWLCTLTLWISLTLIIYRYLKPSKSSSEALPILLAIAGISYIVILINSFCSPAFQFLSSPVQPQQLPHILNEMYQSPPVILMHFEAYHYEHREYYEKAPNGTYVKKEETRTVITHRASDNIRIMSHRDVSQPLFLDLTQVGKKVKFLKLRVMQDIRFAPDGSEKDYQGQVAGFKRKNDWDRHHTYSEERKIQGFREFFFVPIAAGSSVSYIGSGWYALFSVLSLAEPYKNYVNRYCMYHEYTISKEISTISPGLFQPTFTPPPLRIITPDYDNLYSDNRGL